MKRGILALEDNEGAIDTENEAAIAAIPAEELTEERIDADVASTQEEGAQIEGEADQVDEASSMADSIDSMAAVVEDSVTPTPPVEADAAAGTAAVAEVPAEGMPAEAVQVIEAALEHFYVRLGVNRRLTPAMESFNKDRLGSSKIALENLQTLSARIDKNLTVAQEGLFDRITNGFSRLFTSSNKMRAVVRNMKAENLKEAQPIGDPAWARVFGGISGKKSINSKDIAQALGLVSASAKEMSKCLIKAAVDLENIHGELKRKTFGSAKDAVANIEKISREIMKDMEESGRKIPSDVLQAKRDVQVVSCEKADFAAISKFVQSTTEAKELETAVTRFIEAYFSVWDGEDALMMLLRTFNADRRAARRALSDLRAGALERIGYVYHYEYASIHGAYKYLSASIEK